MDKDDLEKRAEAILLRLLRVESPTGGEAPLLEHLSRELEARGFEVHVQPVEGAGGNLLARRGESPVLLSTHTDTVPLWGHPHGSEPIRVGEEVWGRGAIDAKGQIGAMLLAAELTDAPCLFAFFCDEEGMGKGSKAFHPLPGVSWALVLEPTAMRVATAGAGAVEVEVRVRGKAAHGAMASAGRNAIEGFFQGWERARTLPFLLQPPDPFPPLSPNLGRIAGGVDPQVVPDLCEALLDFPFPPGWDPEEVLGMVREVFGAVGGEVTVRDMEPPWQMGEGEEGLLEAVDRAFEAALGRPPERWGIPAWTDATSLRQKGIPTLVLGAGDLALAHTPEERVRLAEVVELALVLKELVEGR